MSHEDFKYRIMETVFDLCQGNKSIITDLQVSSVCKIIQKMKKKILAKKIFLAKNFFFAFLMGKIFYLLLSTK